MRKLFCKYTIIAILIVFLLMALSTTCQALSYGYSVGCKFASGIPHAGDNFKTNVANAANAYGWISNLDSYYNYEPTYSYMSGKNDAGVNRLGGSKVFFINGHANPEVIICGSRNSSSYLTGVSIYNNGYTITESANGLTATYKTAGLNSRSMSGTSIITFAGCSTGKGTNNLVKKAVSKGAKVAVGFKEDVSTRDSNGTNWLKTYNYALGNGSSVSTAISKASSSYPNSSLAKNVVTSGSTGTKLGTVSKSSISKAMEMDSQIKDIIAPIDELHSVVDNTEIQIKNIDETNLKDKELSSYSNVFKSIISKIKAKDESFNINDYKVTYNVINEDEKFGHIFFTYYIDNKIETNKVYMAIVENGKVTDIILAGVKKDNISKMKINEDLNLKNKITNFEKQKDDIIKQKMNNELLNSDIFQKNNGEFNTNDMNSVSEQYFYDYNEGTLKYILNLTQSFGGGITDINTLEIEL